MYAAMELSAQSAACSPLSTALETKPFRLDFHTQYYLTGPLSVDDWLLLSAQYRAHAPIKSTPPEIGIAEHVLPETWHRAA